MRVCLDRIEFDLAYQHNFDVLNKYTRNVEKESLHEEYELRLVTNTSLHKLLNKGVLLCLTRTFHHYPHVC